MLRNRSIIYSSLSLPAPALPLSLPSSLPPFLPSSLPPCLHHHLQMHHKGVRGCRKKWSKLQHDTEQKRQENQQLDREILDLQVSILERQQIDDLAGQPLSEKA